MVRNKMVFDTARVKVSCYAAIEGTFSVTYVCGRFTVRQGTFESIHKVILIGWWARGGAVVFHYKVTGFSVLIINDDIKFFAGISAFYISFNNVF